MGRDPARAARSSGWRTAGSTSSPRPTSGASEHHVRSASTTTGRLLGLDVRFLHDNGAYTPYGIIVPIITVHPAAGARTSSGAYQVEFHSLYTNTVMVTPYRGAGQAPGGVRHGADHGRDRRLQLDRAQVEVRQTNFIQPDEMPYDHHLIFQDGRPLIYDSGDFPATLAQGPEAGRLGRVRGLPGRGRAGQAAGRASAWPAMSRAPGSAPTRAPTCGSRPTGRWWWPPV